MSEIVLTPELTEEERLAYDEKCASLAKLHNVSKVHACVILTPGTFERQVCFIKEPNFPTKLNVASKMTQIGYQLGANELREACTIKDESSPLTYGESADCDPYKMGVVNFCMGLISAYNNILDKKK